MLDKFIQFNGLKDQNLGFSIWLQLSILDKYMRNNGGFFRERVNVDS